MDPDVDPQELGASAAGRSAAASKQQQRQQDEDSATSTSTSSSFPDSPAALARMLNSTAFRAAREARPPRDDAPRSGVEVVIRLEVEPFQFPPHILAPEPT